MPLLKNPESRNLEKCIQPTATITLLAYGTIAAPAMCLPSRGAGGVGGTAVGAVL